MKRKNQKKTIKKAVITKKQLLLKRKLNLKSQRLIKHKKSIKTKRIKRIAIKPTYTERQVFLSPTKQYTRDSIILTAYYKGERMFDIRASIVNSQKDDTYLYLKACIENWWIEWVKFGSRQYSWKKILTKAIESEHIDISDTKSDFIGKVVIESYTGILEVD